MTDLAPRRFGTWLRAHPDRPFVILFAHLAVVALYATGHAVSQIPFSDGNTRTLISSDLVPVSHAAAAVALAVAIAMHRWRGSAAGISLFVWACTTVSLFFASHNRTPPLAYWSFALSCVITLAAFLMLARWGVDGDERGRT